MNEAGRKSLELVLILGAGLIGAVAASRAGLPIPYLMGSMVVTAVLSLTRFARQGTRFWYPPILRKCAIAVIGTLIGSTFSPQAMQTFAELGVTLTAMILFLGLAQVSNFAVFRYLGRYDRVTAAYSAMPGGLIEAVVLGEKAGGDTEVLSLQHFVRLILVVVTVPMLFLIATGEAVGSSAGQTLEATRTGWADWIGIAALAFVGAIAGGRLKLPASYMTGPLLLTAALSGFGIVGVSGPGWALNGAQLIVGAGLGTMFARSTLMHLARAFGLGLVSVGVTLAMAAGFAAVLAAHVELPFQTLFISFAPGGVTEMSLIALSLGVAPVLVTTHHLFRIVFTVSVARWVFPKAP